MTQRELHQSKIESLVKSADLYDLITFSLRASENKIQSMDRYINRAIESQHVKQKTGAIEVDQLSQLTEDNLSNREHMFSESSHFQTENTEMHQVEEGIKENAYSWQLKCLSPNKRVKLGDYASVSQNCSPQRQPLNQSTNQQRQIVESGPQTPQKPKALKNYSPIKAKAKVTRKSDHAESPFKLEVIRMKAESNEPTPRLEMPPQPLLMSSIAAITPDLEVGNQTHIFQSFNQPAIVFSVSTPESCIVPDKVVNEAFGIKIYTEDNSPRLEKTSTLPENQYFSKLSQAYSASRTSQQRSTSSKSLHSKNNEVKSKMSTSTIRDKELNHTAQKALGKSQTERRTPNVIPTPFSHLNNLMVEHDYSTIGSTVIGNKKMSIIEKSHAKGIQSNSKASNAGCKQMTKKSAMIASFKEINLQLFVEMSRIKKPQKFAFIAGKMLCMLVNSLRERPSSDNFDQWPNILAFINQGGVHKFTTEVLLIRSRVMDLSSIPDMSALFLLQDCFFKELSLQQFLNFVTDKHIKTIISLVHNVVLYVTSKCLKKRQFDQTANRSTTSGEFSINFNSEIKGQTPRVMSPFYIPNSCRKDLQAFNVQSNAEGGEQIQHNKRTLNTTKSQKVLATTPMKQTQDFKDFRSNEKSREPKSKHSFNLNRNSYISNQEISKTPTKVASGSILFSSITYNSTIKEQRNTSAIKNSKYQTIQSIKSHRSPAAKYLKEISKSPLRMDKSKTSRNAGQIKSFVKKASLTTFTIPKLNLFQTQTDVSEEYVEQIQVEEVDVEEEVLQFNPEQLSNVFLETRLTVLEMLDQKSLEIESNMRDLTVREGIDLDIIASLKKRRLDNRVKGQVLNAQRDETINNVQQMLRHEKSMQINKE